MTAHCKGTLGSVGYMYLVLSILMVHIGTSPHGYLKDLQISALKFKFPKYLKAIQTINTFEQITT